MVTQVKVLQLLLSAEEEQLWEPVWCGISFMVCWGEVWKGYLPCSNKHWPSATGIHYLIENYIFRHVWSWRCAVPWRKIRAQEQRLEVPHKWKHLQQGIQQNICLVGSLYLQNTMQHLNTKTPTCVSSCLFGFWHLAGSGLRRLTRPAMPATVFFIKLITTSTKTGDHNSYWNTETFLKQTLAFLIDPNIPRLRRFAATGSLWQTPSATCTL